MDDRFQHPAGFELSVGVLFRSPNALDGTQHAFGSAGILKNNAGQQHGNLERNFSLVHATFLSVAVRTSTVTEDRRAGKPLDREFRARSGPPAKGRR